MKALRLDRRTQQFNALVKSSGWSQAEVARQLKVTPGAVSQFRSGKIRPRGLTLRMFKIVLGKDNPAVLKAYENTNAVVLDSWEHELVKALRSLPEKHRQQLLKPLKELIGALQLAGRAA